MHFTDCLNIRLSKLLEMLEFLKSTDKFYVHFDKPTNLSDQCCHFIDKRYF